MSMQTQLPQPKMKADVKSKDSRKKILTKNINIAHKYHKEQYIVSQPQQKQMIFREEQPTISKTKSKQNRKYLSKANFSFDLQGNKLPIKSKVPIPTWVTKSQENLEQLNFYEEFVQRGHTFLSMFIDPSYRFIIPEIDMAMLDEGYVLLALFKEAMEQHDNYKIVKNHESFLKICEMIKIKMEDHIKFKYDVVQTADKLGYQGYWRNDAILVLMNRYCTLDKQFIAFLQLQITELKKIPITYLSSPVITKVKDIFSDATTGYETLVSSLTKLVVAPRRSKVKVLEHHSAVPSKKKETLPKKKEIEQKIKGYPRDLNTDEKSVRNYFNRKLKNIYYTRLNAWNRATNYKSSLIVDFKENLTRLKSCNLNDCFCILEAYRLKIDSTYITSRDQTLKEFIQIEFTQLAGPSKAK